MWPWTGHITNLNLGFGTLLLCTILPPTLLTALSYCWYDCCKRSKALHKQEMDPREYKSSNTQSFYIHPSKGSDGVTEIEDSVRTLRTPTLTYFLHRQRNRDPERVNSLTYNGLTGVKTPDHLRPRSMSG